MMFPSNCLFVCSIVSIVPISSYVVISQINASSTISYYPRDSWGAAPPTDVRPLTTTPVPYVVIHHTAIPGACNTTEQCKLAMAGMQKYHMGLGWGDIGYNFCIGSEGGVYEGRGWHAVGVHTGRANNYSLGICLIGDWRVELPPAVQLESTKAIISSGVDRGIISPSYKLIGHNQVMSTECPGVKLLQEIATWDHYAPGHFLFQ